MEMIIPPKQNSSCMAKTPVQSPQCEKKSQLANNYGSHDGSRYRATCINAPWPQAYCIAHKITITYCSRASSMYILRVHSNITVLHAPRTMHTADLIALCRPPWGPHIKRETGNPPLVDISPHSVIHTVMTGYTADLERGEHVSLRES